MKALNKASALLLAAAAPAAAAAQEAAVPAVPAKVAVTALRPIDAETHTPVYVLTRRDLARMSDLGLGELLQRLPFMGRSAPNLNSNAAGDGSVVADIGGMGPARCIVLLDGQRLAVNETLGTPAADLDTIPVAAIERVEIFLGGASGAWGADAVAGVINIITRPETQGTDITASGARTAHGDGNTGRLSAFTGEVFGRGHVNVTAELRQEDPIDSAARPFSARSETLGCLTGSSCVWPFGSTATPAGLFVVPARNALGLPGGSYTFDTPGQWRPFQAAGPENDLYSTQTDTFLRAGRSGGSLVGSFGYALTDQTEVGLELLASHDRVRRQLAPLPLSTTLTASSLMPLAPTGQLLSATGASVPAPASQVIVAGNNFYNPFGTALSDVRLRLVGTGPRALVDRSDTELFALSLRHNGEVWNWEGSFSASRSAIDEFGSATLNTGNLALALGPSGPDATGVIRCGNPDQGTGPGTGIVTTPIPGCVPFDAFGGPAAITPAMLAYITSPSTSDVSELQLQAGLIARRTLAILPGLPPARLAVGLEGLRTSLQSQSSQSGLAAALEAAAPVPSGGATQEGDLLAELSWPLKRSPAGGQALTLTTGGRLAFAQDNTAVPVGFAALEWHPEPQLLLRSRVTQVYRPPTAGELFLGYQERVLPLGNPCAGLVGVSALCAAGTVPAAATAATAAASESDYLIAGNPHLRPERGVSASSGIVWNSADHPARLASLDLTWIRLNDAIRGPAALELITACQSGTDPGACARIAAVPGSNVFAINGSLINGGRDDSARADFKLGDGWVTRAGELHLEAFASYLLMRRVTDIDGRDIDLRGTFDLTQNVLGTAYPLVLAQAHLEWKRPAWAARWSTDFTGSYRETVDRNGLLMSSGGQVRSVGSVVYHDVSLEHVFAGFATLRVAIENLFDRSPPRVNNGLEDNTDSATYRLEGRIFAASAELTF